MPREIQPEGQPAPADKKLLDYAFPDIEQPPHSRVQIQQIKGGIRLVDPPITESRLRRRIFFQGAYETTAGVFVALLFCLVFRISNGGPFICVAAAIALTSWGALRYAHQTRLRPTVIDVAAGVMALTLPDGKQIIRSLDEIDDIHASRPRRMPGVSGRVSSLIIGARGRRFWLLRRRDHAEVRWVARQLRLATGRSADHPGEPAVRLDDAQEVCEPQKAWSGQLLPVPTPAPVRTKSSFGRALNREYDNLGCAAFIFLFLSAVVGLFATMNFVALSIICLKYGSNAYFHEHLRFVPHRGFALTNGQTLSAPYQVLFIVFQTIAFLPWIGAALAAAIGINRLFQAIERARQRARRAKQRR